MSTEAFRRVADTEHRHAQAFHRAWHKLVPPSAIESRITKRGIEYLHPTKGWRKVSASRFALYAE